MHKICRKYEKYLPCTAAVAAPGPARNTRGSATSLSCRKHRLRGAALITKEEHTHTFTEHATHMFFRGTQNGHTCCCSCDRTCSRQPKYPGLLRIQYQSLRGYLLGEKAVLFSVCDVFDAPSYIAKHVLSVVRIFLKRRLKRLWKRFFLPPNHKPKGYGR